MITLRFRFLPLAIFVVLAATLIGCTDDGMDAAFNDNDFLISEGEMGDGAFGKRGRAHTDFMMVEELRSANCEGGLPTLPECAVVTTSGDTYPKTTVIEFGEDCKDKQGHARLGKVTVVETADLKVKGAIKKITFEHTGKGDFTKKGVKRIENMGKNTDGHFVFATQMTMSGIGQKGDFERKSEGEIVWLKGMDTEDCEDDVMSITGQSQAFQNEEEMGSRVIIKPIVKDFNCKHPIAGTIEMKGKRGEAIMDFGDGACDSKGTITKDGETKEVDLEKMKQHKKGRKPRRR